jgi:hypothetical protein
MSSIGSTGSTGSKGSIDSNKMGLKYVLKIFLQ